MSVVFQLSNSYRQVVPQLRELRSARMNLRLLADAIEARREELQLSARQAARRLGLTPSTLTRVRQGKRPDAEALAVLLAWTGLDAAQLLMPYDPALTTTPKSSPQRARA